MQHAPKAIFAIGGADARCQPVQHFDGVGDGSNRHPIRGSGAARLEGAAPREAAPSEDWRQAAASAASSGLDFAEAVLAFGRDSR